MKLLMLDGNKSTKEIEYITNKEIEIDLNNENLGVAIRIETEFVKPYGKQWHDETMEFVEGFIETDDKYIFSLSNGYEYDYNKSEVKGKPRFYELQEICWLDSCEKLVPYSDRITLEGTHYKGTEKSFDRDWYFCSEKCADKYLKENIDFTIS